MTDDDVSEGRRELSWIWITGNSVPIEGDEFEVAEGTVAQKTVPMFGCFILFDL